MEDVSGCAQHKGVKPHARKTQTFEINRVSQFMNWSEAALESYLGDLAEAEKSGRNLLTEKYARMMKLISPVKCALIQHLIPPLDPEVSPLIDQVVDIVREWEQALASKYPHIFSRARPLRSSEDSSFATSLETSLRGELATYSLRYGFNSLGEAEERLKARA